MPDGVFEEAIEIIQNLIASYEVAEIQLPKVKKYFIIFILIVVIQTKVSSNYLEL